MAKVKKPKDKANRAATAVMVNEAIKNLAERGGSSLHAIKKFISEHHEVDIKKLALFIRKYLKKAVAEGTLVQPKGSGANGAFKFPSTARPKKATKAAKEEKPKESSKKTKSEDAASTTKKAAATKTKDKPAAAEKSTAVPKRHPWCGTGYVGRCHLIQKVRKPRKKVKSPTKPKAPRPKKAADAPKSSKPKRAAAAKK